MMEFSNIRSVYFLGAGGIGMSAIARYFMSKGLIVGGYDKTSTPLTDELEREGMRLHFEDDVTSVDEAFKSPKHTLVVITPAIPAGHSEWSFFQKNGFEIMKRSQVLGLIARDNFTVAVAGTHGKTTTSSLIAHLLRSAGIPCTAFLGGIAKNYNTNLLIGHEVDGRHIVVVEADEYDRSFLTLFPEIAVITSMDPDHLDIYGSPDQMHATYRSFASQVKKTGLLISRSGLDVGKHECRMTDYSLRGPSKQHAANILVQDHRYTFDWTDGVITYKSLTTGMPGEHNVENAVAAVTVARSLGLDEAKIRAGLASYDGVRRRFDYQVREEDCVYIDDYAHHPEELRACIASVRELYPGREITGVFQPHLFSRTRDFADGFVKSLSMLDRLLLMDIYPARELPIPGVTSTMLLDKIPAGKGRLCSPAEVLDDIRSHRPSVLLTLGAGDIDQLVGPIREILNKKP